MKNLLGIMVAVSLAAFTTAPALAQSSGNFAATIDRTACALDNSTGALSGGITVVDWDVKIKAPNGNGTSLDIRPSFVTGLFTKTKIDTTLSTATAVAGVEVCVKIDQGTLNGIPGPNAEHCVWYDKRFQQISSQLFSQLTACTAAPTTTACTADADCSSLGTGFTCNTTTGFCVGPNPNCNFELILSTLSAHSFDFVAYNIPGGIRTVNVKANFFDSDGTGGNAVACVGPGVVTVTQTKVFGTSSGIVDLTP